PAGVSPTTACSSSSPSATVPRSATVRRRAKSSSISSAAPPNRPSRATRPNRPWVRSVGASRPRRGARGSSSYAAHARGRTKSMVQTAGGLIERERSCLIVIDVQQYFLDKLPLHERGPLVQRIAWLMRVARALDTPIVATAEDIERNGPLVPDLAGLLPP